MTDSINIETLDKQAQEIDRLADALRDYCRKENMPTVKCECGATYHGWALVSMKCYCDVCGKELKV